MNIGDASKTTGISVKMIRYYESIGLIPAALRTFSGYRVYNEREIETLGFIRKARDLGFLVEDIERLIQLWRDIGRPSADVQKVFLGQIKEVERKIADLQEVAGNLRRLAGSCHANTDPHCAIIDYMQTVQPVRRKPVAAPRFDGISTLARGRKRTAKRGPRLNALL
jgi:MerR family copper efflux transcriptional regulator